MKKMLQTGLNKGDFRQLEIKMVSSFELGDIVQMKKKHPCGSKEWKIIRTGADVKIKCLVCDRIVMMDRADFCKRAVKIIEVRRESE